MIWPWPEEPPAEQIPAPTSTRVDRFAVQPSTPVYPTAPESVAARAHAHLDSMDAVLDPEESR